MPQDESLKKVQSNSISIVAMYDDDGGGEGNAVLRGWHLPQKCTLFGGVSMMWPPMFVWTARGPEVSCLHYLNCGIARAMNVFHDMPPT